MERPSLSTGLLPPLPPTPTAPPLNTRDDACYSPLSSPFPPASSLFRPTDPPPSDDDLFAFWREYKQHIVNRTRFSLLVAAFCVAGFLSGAVSVALSLALPNADNFVSGNQSLFTSPLAFLFVPAAMVCIHMCIRTFFVGTGGSGIPAAMLLLDREDSLGLVPKVLSLRILIGKFALLYLGIMSGGSMGKEGPMVILSASTTVLTLDLFLKFSGERRTQITRNLLRYSRVMIVAGAGAGIAAAFNSITGGIMFAIEEFASEFDSTLGRCLAISVVSSMLAVFGMNTLLDPNYENLSFYGDVIGEGARVCECKGIGRRNIAALCRFAPRAPRLAANTATSLADFATTGELFYVSITTGLLGGLLGGLNAQALLFLLELKAWTTRRSAWASYVWCLVSAAVLGGLLMATDGLVSGEGTSEVVEVLAPSGTYCEKGTIPAHFGFTKIFGTLLTYLAGVCGGVFAPSLSAGAGLGQLFYCEIFSKWNSNSSSQFVVLCTMTSFFGGFTQSPLTSFSILIGMVHVDGADYDGPVTHAGMLVAAVIGSVVSSVVNPTKLYHGMSTIVERGWTSDVTFRESEWKWVSCLRRYLLVDGVDLQEVRMCDARSRGCQQPYR